MKCTDSAAKACCHVSPPFNVIRLLILSAPSMSRVFGLGTRDVHKGSAFFTFQLAPCVKGYPAGGALLKFNAYVTTKGLYNREIHEIISCGP
jgi:hypothetical protein